MYKEQAEQISFNHTKRVLENKISIVFYDMTTVYFESIEQDDSSRLIISYSSKRAKKDETNREKGLKRLELNFATSIGTFIPFLIRVKFIFL